MKKILLLGALVTALMADTSSIAGGIWFNYAYNTTSEADNSNGGTIGDEALILYADHAVENTPWSLSAEMRFGPGSFTDIKNNSTGDNFVLHKAWIAYEHSDALKLFLGKSQVPFGWKTANFWPGDMFLASFGDQMDVGLKAMGSIDNLAYALAYYHSDDWGATSTDTTDDNRHWGSSDTYRKVQTFVGDISYQFPWNQKLGLSLQSGRLQDLNSAMDASNPVDGSHAAAALYYHGVFDDFYLKAEGIMMQRELPKNYYTTANKAKEIEGTRAAVEAGYTLGKWFMYLDATWADTQTDGNENDAIMAYAPGVSYNYGPGWIYLEYLTQDGWMDRDSDVNEGDFSSLYVTVDYYF